MLVSRIVKLLHFFGLSKSACARELGVSQKTFNDHMTEKNQGKLWSYLPKFLEWYPRLSRQWLYFGEGPMLIGHGIPLDEPVPLQAIVEAVEDMGKEAGGTQGDLLRYIAGIPLNDSQREDMGSAVLLEENRNLNAKILELYAELNEVRRELDRARQATIAVYEEQKGRAVRGNAVGGISSAVHCVPHDSERQ